MKKLNTKIGAILGTAVVALGLMVLPALADTSGTSNWFGQMRNLMNQTFTPAQQQQFMSSSAMQKLHNSSAMQQAMQDGDLSRMQSLMNSDQELKAQIGSQNVDKMNQMVRQVQEINLSGKNSNQELKAQISSQSMANMNQMMKQVQGMGR